MFLSPSLHCVIVSRYMYRLKTGVFATLASIDSVEEGQNLTVCIKLVCSQATLGFGIDFQVDLNSSTKTGS